MAMKLTNHCSRRVRLCRTVTVLAVAGAGLAAGLAGLVLSHGPLDAAAPADAVSAAGGECANGSTPVPVPADEIDVLPFINFWGVPQLGCEPVAGTGCGGDGSIGDVIPDGLWRGNVENFDNATIESSTSLEFDLVCAYIGEVGQQMFDDFMGEHPDYGSPPFINGEWIVNNNERTRTVPLADGFRVTQAYGVPLEVLDDGTIEYACGGSDYGPRVEPSAEGGIYEVWLYMDNGEAVEALKGCPHD